MSEDTNETEGEAVAEPKRKQLYYTNPEVRVKLIDILKTNKIAYLSLVVTTTYIEVIQDDGINDDDEGTHESLEGSAPAADVTLEITREDVAAYTEEDVDDVLEGHGVDPADFDDLDAKRAAVEKIVFIDLD